MQRKREADVVIVGAGVAGAAAAVRLMARSVGSVVLVEREAWPRQRPCASVLTAKAIEQLRALGIWDAVQAQAYPLSGVRVLTRGGREVYAPVGDRAALVCPRETLDAVVVCRAQELGADFVPAFSVTQLIQDQGRVRGVVAADGREVRARYTLVADGARSAFGLDDATKPKRTTLSQVWEQVPFKSQHAEVIFDPALAAGFGWLVPHRNTRASIGVVFEDTGTSARQVFDAFVAKHYHHRLSRAQAVSEVEQQPSVCTFRPQKLYSAGRLVVGEAGRMAHPLSGEGISYGMQSGILGADAIHRVLKSSVGEAEAFADYEAACQRACSFFGARIWQRLLAGPALDLAAAVLEIPTIHRYATRLLAD
jgi:geranylgeranyl reductase family protein